MSLEGWQNGIALVLKIKVKLAWGFDSLSFLENQNRSQLDSLIHVVEIYPYSHNPQSTFSHQARLCLSKSLDNSLSLIVGQSIVPNPRFPRWTWMVIDYRAPQSIYLQFPKSMWVVWGNNPISLGNWEIHRWIHFYNSIMIMQLVVNQCYLGLIPNCRVW